MFDPPPLPDVQRQRNKRSLVGRLDYDGDGFCWPPNGTIFSLFEHVIIVSSAQDRYTPQHSVRAELTEFSMRNAKVMCLDHSLVLRDRADTMMQCRLPPPALSPQMRELEHVYAAMVNGFWSSVQTERVLKVDVDFVVRHPE